MEIIKKFIRNVRLELDDEFDRNFERKAFFDKAWEGTRLTNNKGSLMMRTAALRNSTKSSENGSQITWHSSLPYASLHNEGGEITVTEKMKAYFWAKYYVASKAAGEAEIYNIKKREQNATNKARAHRFNKEAEQWKALALKKVGSKIKVEQRQFIGDHPQVRRSIETVWNETVTPELEQYIKNVLSKKII